MKKFILFLLMIMSSSLVFADDADFVKDGLAYKILSLSPAQLEVVAKEEGYVGNITIPDYVMLEGKKFTVTSIGENAFSGLDPYNCNITGIVLPSGLVTIKESAFTWSRGIKKLKLPNGLKSIGANAFVYCNMDSLIIPGTVKTLSIYCFDGCESLEYLEFEEGVTKIPKMTFSSCPKLKTLILPSSINTIEAAAFEATPVKTVISKRKTSPEISGSYWFSGGRGTHTLYNPFTYSDSDDKPICVLVVPSGSTESYKNLTTQDNKAAWPVETIEEYNEGTDFSLIGTEFSSNDNNYIVTNAGSTNNVQLVGNVDSEVTNISIPVSVDYNGSLYKISSINTTHYSQNKKLRDVTAYSNSPLDINANTFSNVTCLMGHLYVPKGKVNVYKQATGWNEFSNISEIKDKYKLIYKIGGELYKSYEIEEGATITPEPAPVKEGYTFSGWSVIPATMPAHDVTVTGSFTINKYKLTYVIDGVVYQSYELNYGATITPEPAPMKEGYTFNGWSVIPATMPAHDVTVTGSFSINKYKLTYVVDGAVYQSYELNYGTSITPEPTPTKEGYTFSGWSVIPATMPAHDVTVTGSFSINKYKLTYLVDGVVYQSYELNYGTSITPEPSLTKVGYTFSGWSEIPETMPAHDVTVVGTFSINKYKLTYMVDGEEYKSYETEYGAMIIPEAYPTKEGYTFSGWSEIPGTMPANDVTITGSFTINQYQVTYIVDGAIFKTEYVKYASKLTPPSIPEKEGYSFAWNEYPETMPANDIIITGQYTINSYKLSYVVDGVEYKSYDVVYNAAITPEPDPTKEGYSFSGWSEIPETMPAHDVTISGTFDINMYKLTYIMDNKVYKETKYEYGATIIPEPQPEGDYASFEWINQPQTMPAHDVVVYAVYTSGISDVLMANQRNIRIYSPNGKKLNKLQKGLNIVILDDGTVKRVVVK